MTDALRASYDFCTCLSRREARNFYWSFRLLPPDRRRSMCALYAYMRHTDDLADESGSPEVKRAALESWRTELDHSLDGGPSTWPGLPALADTVQKHGIPRQYLHEALNGCLMDVDAIAFSTFSELHAYCYRVASVVGLCCLHIWGFRSENGRAERLAETCGVALQLTNILRDVREDANAGRIYIPREDLDQFGVAPSDLVAGHSAAHVLALFEFEGRRAYDCYRESRPLIRLVEPVGRPVLQAIVGIYRALLDEIARRDYNVLAGRISLPSWRKAAITVRSLVLPFRA
jgi:15-cis-phytoene synthase